MNKYVHLMYCLAEFFLEWGMFQKNFVSKSKYIMVNNIFPKIVPFLRSCGKIRWSRIVDMSMRHMRISCWISKATDTHCECVILIALPL